jgi:hypothetical protein
MRQTDIMPNKTPYRFQLGALRLKRIQPQTNTMSKLIEKYVIPLKHKKCGYQWNYGGNRPYYATCPNCRNQVNIRKNVIGSEQVLGGASAHSISATNKGVNP